jgi:ankyrin repeat protein
VYENCIEAAEYLINIGIDLTAEDYVGDLALHLAAEFGHTDMISLLVQHIDVDYLSSSGESALICAIRMNQIEAIKLLLHLGANPNLKQPNKNEWTPLFSSVYQGRLEATKVLVGIGQADVDALDKDGNTPLHIAERYDKLEIFKYLLSVGADYKIKNKKGFTAAQYAKEPFVKALVFHQKKSQGFVKQWFRERENKKQKVMI